jgi:hypothetical protein
MKTEDFHMPLMGGMAEIQCSDSNFYYFEQIILYH